MSEEIKDTTQEVEELQEQTAEETAIVEEDVEYQPTEDELAQEYADTIMKLRRLISKSARNITNQDKIYLKGMAEMNGVKLPENLQCPSCWIDIALQIYKVLKEQNEPKQSGDYVLKSGVDVLYNGMRINEYTITDTLAAKWIADGFPTVYFEKWK